MPGSSCRKVVLESLQIDRNVCRKVCASRCKERLPRSGVHGRKNLWHESILKWHRNVWQRGDQGLENEWEVSSDIVFQPQIRENRRDRSPGMKCRVFAHRVIQ